ncbi:MAG TPA: hypothetical protein PKY59_12545 [Pyrinomonadaceae bacterium]|nr:hypothetical protein [Pyrinomonadaceae bacterium]
MKIQKVSSFLSTFTALIFLTIGISASEPAIWSVNSKADVLKGDSRGVSIADNGTITIAPKLSEVFKTDQSYVWSSAVDDKGNVFLGTGADGKIFKVDASGKGTLFYDATELNVSALALGKNGELYAGTSPDGKVYRIEANGTASVFFEPKEKYIWSLAILADGSLAIGTGENGKIYKVRSANSAPESSLLFDTSETHIISLATDKNGNLFAGTDSNGLVLRFGADGKPFALLDSTLREIHELSIGADGSVYALALGESTSSTATATPSATPESATVSVEKPNPTATETPAKSRYDLANAKSAVYRILPDGGADILWSSPSVTGFSLFAQPNGGVLLGTSDKGRIYSVTNDGRETLVLQSDEGQVSTIKANGQNIIATTSNQGKLYRFGTETNAEGTYESAVLDAKNVSSWGRIWWRGNGNVSMQTRSGNTEKPNETWSAWSVAYTDAKGAQINSPKAKFIQWRAVLKNSASLSEANVSFLPRNISPEVLTIQILPTNVGLAANPPMQIDPNIELSGLDPAVFGVANAAVPPRRVYQRGATALQWTAEDRNGDKLSYSIFYRETSETNFKLLKENLTENFYTIDGQSLADGRYIFKVVAKDSLSNPANQTLSGERLSEPVDIDNSAPTVTAFGSPQISGDNVKVIFDATETTGFINRAEYSVNGGNWVSVYADDGISDSTKERYTIDLSLKNAGEYSVTLRVWDANGNAGNARVVVKK